MAKRRFDIEVIVILQKTARNRLHDFLPVVFPILPRKPLCGFIQPRRHIPLYGPPVFFIQRRRYRRVMSPFLVLPNPWHTGVRAAFRVVEIKHIPGKWNSPGSVHEDDSLGIAPDVTAHSFPDRQIRADADIGPLGEYEKLVLVGPFVQPARKGQERFPFGKAVGDMDRSPLRNIRVIAQFIRHQYPPPCQRA
ncbi:MAG: hypothetical protein IJT94_18440 [Oscillibacter sp.]|nr:hypothetical protein [Oscillibacter sp.]